MNFIIVFVKMILIKNGYFLNDLTCFRIEELSKEIKFEEVYMIIYKNIKEYIYQEEKEYQ